MNHIPWIKSRVSWVRTDLPSSSPSLDKGRAMMRSLLNERQLYDVILAICNDSSLLSRFYRADAIMNRSDDAMIIQALLNGVQTGIPFSLNLNPNDLLLSSKPSSPPPSSPSLSSSSSPSPLSLSSSLSLPSSTALPIKSPQKHKQTNSPHLAVISSPPSSTQAPITSLSLSSSSSFLASNTTTNTNTISTTTTSSPKHKQQHHRFSSAPVATIE
eukprot:TRINITY_DN1634_c0_g1_i1.p1 TRINITY_DN1634_c0_g1~~TRINITY_DN1634_c0_g1_i1.p1  ORF type:complete len:215 (-),score=69.98 TRINITY_DN1634_c0_g1_i1:29-673(-)